MEVAWRKGAQPSIKLPLQSRNRTAIAATEPLASIALSQFALNEPLGGGTHLQKVGEILWEAWATCEDLSVAKSNSLLDIAALIMT